VKIPARVEIDMHFWNGRRVLVSGHTGFKGAWLSLWLEALGAELTGIARGPAPPRSVHALAGLSAGMRELNVDVRDVDALGAALRQARPEVVLHLAGQPLVGRSLEDPVGTYVTNVMGTVDMLDAVRLAGEEVRALVVVTSDKCYENDGAPRRAFSEPDRLGGADPYSSSKACAELVVSSYRRSFFSAGEGPLVASARAGNVIGGGDWGEGRIVADCVRAVEAGAQLRLRNPAAVRPWQHVLNPLSGYLLLAERLHRGEDVARAWNFGPPASEAQSVSAIVECLRGLWGEELRFEIDGAAKPAEADRVTIDSSSARRELGWRAPWDLAQALERVVEWHRALREGRQMREISLAQIERFMADAALS